MGYPGHVNCTENFNHALAPYGVRPRKGWEALNYFYNTNIDHQNQLYLDEPWSRPGDYVLMRALTDLVCVSSSCPDDIDAANGWDPTDIHIRTYAAKQKFSRAVVTRMTPDADAHLTKETAFHPRFSALTRNTTEYRGYWLPQRFNNDGPIEEYWACRENVTVTDLSPLRKFEVTGPDAEALLQYCVTRDIRKLSVGQVVYTAMCYENGGMIDDGTVFRLGQNNFRWIGGDEFSGQWLRQQAEKMGYKAWVRSSTDQLHNIAVQGPKSRDLLKEIIWTSPAQTAIGELEWFRFAVARIGHFEGAPIVVSRTGYTGELGYEIFCHPKDALAVFDAVWEAGQKYGLKPMGLEALDMVRIEAGLIFANYEFTSETDPFEAGIGFTVPLKSKSDDFIGKQALIQRKEHPRHRLVGLDIESNEAVGHGDSVYMGRSKIGVVTSSTRSPVLGKNIALARVDVLHSEIGTGIEIGKLDGMQKRLPGHIVRFAHYDPEKLRPRS
jgi:aminomethyltransferase